MQQLIMNRLFGFLLLILIFGSCNSGSRVPDFLLEKKEISAREDVLLALQIIYSGKPVKDDAIILCKSMVMGNQFQQARLGLDRLESLYGKWSDISWLRAVCYRNELMLDQARASLDELKTLEGESQRWKDEINNLAVYKDFWSEILIYDSILAGNQGDPCRLKRAELFAGMQKFAESQFDLEKILVSDSMNFEARNLKGINHLMLGEYDQAVNCYRLLNEKKWGNAGFLLSASERLDKANRAYLNRTSDPAVYKEYAVALAEIERSEKAISVLDEGLKLFSGDYNLLYTKLILLIHSKDTLGARKVADELKARGFKVDKARLGL